MLKKTFFPLIFISLILAACGGPSPEEEIYEHLEEAVRLEADFEAQQDEITALEIEEQEIFEQIGDLSLSEMETIQQLAERALAIIEERREKLTIERDSIYASKEEFEKIHDLIQEISAEEVKDKADELYQVMMARYDAYDVLYDAYDRSLKLEKELYILYQDETVTEEVLREQIAKINDTYQEVLDSNDKFNDHTVTYNELKKEFYDLADIQVVYKED